MKVIQQASQLASANRGVCLAIGMFDGVHLGHQRVLNQTLADSTQTGAISVAVTFDQHPNAVVAPAKTPPLVYSLAHRLRVIGETGIEVTLLIHFDPGFSKQPAETFIRCLASDFGRIITVSVGHDFTFGHGRRGNVALLNHLGQDLGFTVHDLAAVSWDRSVISSTRIRRAIQSGNLEAASAMLGRPYSISARVLGGDQLGRKLGFPTANLDAAGLALPPMGVYAGYGLVQGVKYQAVANLGQRPTVRAQTQLQVEVHLLNFNGDLYGQELEFAFIRRLREERKFPSLQALREQIGKDIAEAKVLLA